MSALLVSDHRSIYDSDTDFERVVGNDKPSDNLSLDRRSLTGGRKETERVNLTAEELQPLKEVAGLIDRGGQGEMFDA